MIYILVNNNYHLIDLKSYLQDVDIDDLCLIRIPHTLSDDLLGLTFKKIYTFPYFYTGIKSLLNVPGVRRQLRSVRESLTPRPDDVLVVFTDFEVLNQYIIAHFRKYRCRIAMLEDGMATVCVGNMEKQRLTLSNRLVKFIFRRIYGFSYLDMFGKGHNIFPIIKDTFIDGIGLSIKAPVNRNIPAFQLSTSASVVNNLKDDVLLFINQDIYNFGIVTMDEYIAELDRIFEAATRNFREVYFKFHPREKPADIKRIEDVMSKYQVTLLATKQPIELVIDEIRPQYVASFYSSALKSLFLRGVQPFFLYHLLQVFRDRSIVDTLNKYLQYINYLFIKKYDDIKPGYRCSILTDASALTFKEFIDRL